VIEIPTGRWEDAYDPTTGLATLWSFLEHTHRSLQRVARQPRTLAVLSTALVELGDPRLAEVQRLELLLEVTARLQAVIRAGDLVARAGPAGFLMLCEDLESLDQAIAITERVLDVLDRPFEVSGDVVSIETHIGIGLPLGADVADGLLRRSLDAMYAARADPRRRFDVIIGSPDPDQLW
jgi:two-component system, sensor histidine kinase LadS